MMIMIMIIWGLLFEQKMQFASSTLHSLSASSHQSKLSYRPKRSRRPMTMNSRSIVVGFVCALFARRDYAITSQVWFLVTHTNTKELRWFIIACSCLRQDGYFGRLLTRCFCALFLGSKQFKSNAWGAWLLEDIDSSQGEFDCDREPSIEGDPASVSWRRAFWSRVLIPQGLGRDMSQVTSTDYRYRHDSSDWPSCTHQRLSSLAKSYLGCIIISHR